MSLLDRIEGLTQTDRSASNKTQVRLTEVKAKVRERLYEEIPPERVSKMVGSSPAVARKELAAAIDGILRSEQTGLPEQERERVCSDLLNDILGLGPIEVMLDDASITEIMVNGPASVFYERDGKLGKADAVFDDDEHVMRVIDRIVAPLGRRVDERSPMVNARLPEGHRVNVVIRPLSLGGPTITIRKFRTKIFGLEELAEMGALTPAMTLFLNWCVEARQNIAVSGGTGSGKTTLLNALSIQIPKGERIITVEDSAELRFQQHPHVVGLEARPANIEGEGEVSIRDLVINTLRMRPDRIVVGEVRGGEALDMLQAMNTGHDGSLTTLHANSPQEAISRLTTMVRYVADLPISAIHEQIAGALDLIVHISRFSDGSRRVTHIVEVLGIEDSVIQLSEVVVYLQEGVDASGKVIGHYEYRNKPSCLARLVTSGVVSKEEAEAWRP